MEIFKEQIEIIKNNGFKFNIPNKFDMNYDNPKSKKEILITIDDAFLSFYENAWPYLKENKIPFILFVSTEPIGKSGYMNWKQIKEIEKEDFVFIGNHSHSHKYMVSLDFNKFKQDIDLSAKIFKDKLGYNPIFFSYPFGEYNLEQKEYIKKKFKFAFGQHSGLIDVNKDKFELPRFPINEKYGNLDRFKFLINLQPLQFKKLTPEEKYLNNNNNPPNFSVEFFKDQRNIENINCFSNEGNVWKKSKIKFEEKNVLKIYFSEKFASERGRINCSLNDKNGWRWLGIQYVISNY